MAIQETLTEFRNRTHAFIYLRLDPSRPLETRPGLEQKVDPAGWLLPYHGNTVVFDLPEPAKAALQDIQNLLYAECSPILSERLEERTLHITLHDLRSGPPSQELEHAMEALRPEARRLVHDIRQERRTIRMVSTALFDMVNTSMVLGFEPEDEESCEVLMDYYARFQTLLPLPYQLTPHVTLAYFRPGIHGPHWSEALQNVVDLAATRPPIHLTLTGNDVEFQIFSSMNHYQPG